MSENLPYHIRPAVPGDAQNLVNLVTRGLPGYPFESVYDSAQVAHAIDQGEHRLVAVGPQKNIIATAVLDISPQPMAEIKRVVVDPEYRHNGLAKTITANLVDDCQKLGKIPWADARADQVGMQKAAINGGLAATSVESGKHIVYQHDQLGPARESMVHLSGLHLDTQVMANQLLTWPEALKSTLLKNLESSLRPPIKDERLVREVLPSAAILKETIGHRIEAISGIDVQNLSSYIKLLSLKDSQIIIILPDASGFITQASNSDINHLTKISEKIGLQIITYYCPVDDVQTSQYLMAAGLQPAMIRPWHNDEKSPPQWQVGWRKTMNHYQQCLHSVNLDPTVKDQITHLILQL